MQQATGVEDRYIENGIRYEYLSDFDFLIVTKDRKEKDYILTDRIVNKCTGLFKTPVSPIIHEIDFINQGLSKGQYFFIDILKEGVVLHDTGKISFVNPMELTDIEKKSRAKEYFDDYFARALGYIKGVKFYLQENELKIAAFTCHQAAETLYNTVLLVFTGYKPKTHSLEKLRHYAKPYSKELFAIFPEPTEDKQLVHLFDLLKRGYIDARYKADYVITLEELSALIRKIEEMKEVVHHICTHYLDK